MDVCTLVGGGRCDCRCERPDEHWYTKGIIDVTSHVRAGQLYLSDKVLVARAYAFAVPSRLD